MARHPRWVLACALALAVLLLAFVIAVIQAPVILFALWG